MGDKPIRPDVRKHVTKWELIGTGVGIVAGGVALGAVLGIVESHTHWDLGVNNFLLEKFNAATGLSGASPLNPTEVIVDASIGGAIGGGILGFSVGRRLGHKYGVKTY